MSDSRPLPRFRLRTLLIAVAVVALALGIGMLIDRKIEFARRVRLYFRRWQDHACLAVNFRDQ